MHDSSKHGGDRILHVARLDVPRKVDPHDLERGRLSARSADSPLPPSPSEKTRIRTSSGAEGGYLGAVRWEVSGSGSRRMRPMDTPALEGIMDEGTATKIGGAMAHWPNIG